MAAAYLLHPMFARATEGLPRHTEVQQWHGVARPAELTLATQAMALPRYLTAGC